MPESRFDAWVAERYDLLWPELFDPTLVESTVVQATTHAVDPVPGGELPCQPGQAPCGRAMGRPVAALVIAGVAVREGVQAWRGDTCCSPVEATVTYTETPQNLCSNGCCSQPQ